MSPYKALRDIGKYSQTFGDGGIKLERLLSKLILAARRQLFFLLLFAIPECRGSTLNACAKTFLRSQTVRLTVKVTYPIQSHPPMRSSATPKVYVGIKKKIVILFSIASFARLLSIARRHALSCSSGLPAAHDS